MDAHHDWIGRALPRREDAALLRGQGRYVDDIAPAGCLVLEVLRSPFAAGAIVTLDVSAARLMPGVVMVLTAQDVTLAAGSAVNPLLPGGDLVGMEPLAQSRVAAAGQAVAAVVAVSAMAARDAVEAIVLDVAEDGVSAGGITKARWGVSLPPFNGAVTAQVGHARVAPFALEPRAALAVPQATGLTVYLSTQTPQRGRDDL
jgi:carbon-monoxide dehydrogenase large subunit